MVLDYTYCDLCMLSELQLNVKQMFAVTRLGGIHPSKPVISVTQSIARTELSHLKMNLRWIEMESLSTLTVEGPKMTNLEMCILHMNKARWDKYHPWYQINKEVLACKLSILVHCELKSSFHQISELFLSCILVVRNYNVLCLETCFQEQSYFD